LSAILEVRGLKTYYYLPDRVIHAVDGVDLSVPRNSVVAIVGESGSGKTTLVHSILRLLPRHGRIVEGQILFEGTDLVKLGDEAMAGIRGRKIAMVFQEPVSYLNPVLTVGEQVGEVLEVHRGMPRREAKERALELLRLVRIPDPERIYGYYPHQLSGGMAQRVVIAAALACDPSLLIADEPTSALDVTVQMQILALFRELQKRLGLSIILVSHDLAVVAYMADYVYVMYGGKICEYGGIEIFRSPKHPYTQALLSAALDLRKRWEGLLVLRGSVPDLADPPSGCRFHPRCPYAMKVCAMVEPGIGVTDHSGVACHLY
jgi:peptide/nickel transport system ATP-binding protein